MNSLLMCSDLKRSFGHEEVLRGIDLILPQKGLIGISGPSGSGKSTLLHILAGLDASYSGRYVFKGMDMGKKDEAERSRIRLLSMGYVLQKDSLLDLEDAETNVLFIKNNKTVLNIFRVTCIVAVFLGARADARTVWNISDLLMGLMAVVNIVVILLIGNTAIKALKDYLKQKKEGKIPVFAAKNADIENTDVWK